MSDDEILCQEISSALGVGHEASDECNAFTDALSGEVYDNGALSKHAKFSLKPISLESFNALHCLERLAKDKPKLNTAIRDYQQ